MRHDETLRERVRRHLERFEPADAAGPPALRSAAVAMVLLRAQDDDESCFLITRRAAGLRRHGGQWALPGGRLDEGETNLGAALRELGEELGLALDEEACLGRLDTYVTRSGFAVTPVVLWLEGPARMSPDPGEVAAVYRVPLDDLDAPEVPHLERIPESRRPVLSIPMRSLGTRIFAPTAAMLYQLREVALHGRDTRIDGFEQPVFAWR